MINPALKKNKSIDSEPDYSIKDFSDRYPDFQSLIPHLKPQLYQILNTDPMIKRKLKRFTSINQNDIWNKKLLDKKHEEIDKVSKVNVARC
ncbi:hypothetical protein HK103_006021 [Boothiomyces macroporosus]|uniref:Uncharacterized protein n=1 Tax=Boothiomyces macroporosus TaxID=261099 RepID=A0AAD5UQY0_9FUNG|nr:hypothetical protein HK103_006021 [Boothiomyces macroporosus]